MCELCSAPTFITNIKFCGFVASFINWAWPFGKQRGEMATGSSEVASPDTKLGEDDLGALYESLYPARNSYKSIGLLIGVKIGEIENIESNKTDYGDCLLAVLSLRLNKAKPLTWNAIDSALRSECVGESRLSDEIRKRYGHFFIPDPSTESDSEQEHPTGDHRARLSKESSEYEIVRSKKHVQEVESVDGEDSVSSRKGKLSKRENLEKHDKERAKGINKFMKDEEVVREKSKQKKKATHDREVSVKGYGDWDHYSDGEVCEKVCEKVRKGSSKICEVYTKSESEASSNEEEIEDSSHKQSARRKVTKHTQVIIKERHPQKEYRKDGKKKDAIPQSSDEQKVTQKLRKSEKVKTASEEELSFTSSSDEEENEDHKSTKKSKHTETKSAAHMTHYESEEKGNTSGKKRVSLKPKSTTAEASHYPEECEVKGKTVRVDDKVRKSTDSSRETYHKTRSKPPTKDDEREVVSKKKATAPPLERVLPSAETDSGDGEDENESEQMSSDEEETENDDSSSVEEKEKSKQTASTLTTTTEMRKTKSQDDDENSKQKKSSIALSKDDSHGDKEGSDYGGSRDQEDQPKKRNRRKHRESNKSPIVRGGSSPSSSQEERKPGSRRQRRTHKHGGKYKRREKKKRRETISTSSDTDSSSSESEMLKTLTKSEKKKLKKVFKHSFGKLCSASFDPVETAFQLQKKGLISSGMMMDIIRSPESQQDKIIRLVSGLDNRIRSRPERLFGCIEVLLENDALQEVGREMLRETGNPIHTSSTWYVCAFPNLCRCNIS